METTGYVGPLPDAPLPQPITVVTLFRGARPVAASACWPGRAREEARRLCTALNLSYDHMKVRDFNWEARSDGIQRFVQPVKRYGFR